jgi:hypothetical protein
MVYCYVCLAWHALNFLEPFGTRGDCTLKSGGVYVAQEDVAFAKQRKGRNGRQTVRECAGTHRGNYLTQVRFSRYYGQIGKRVRRSQVVVGQSSDQERRSTDRKVKVETLWANGQLS